LYRVQDYNGLRNEPVFDIVAILFDDRFQTINCIIMVARNLAQFINETHLAIKGIIGVTPPLSFWKVSLGDQLQILVILKVTDHSPAIPAANQQIVLAILKMGNLNK
jgi:hypothetical protein